MDKKLYKKQIKDFADEELFYASFEIEKQWKMSLPKFTPKELQGIFHPTQKTIRLKIKDWQEECDKIKIEIKRVLKIFKEKSEKDLWFAEIFINKLLYPDLLIAQRHIYRLKGLQAISQNKKSHIDNFNVQLEIARNYPIEILAQSRLDIRPAGKNFICCCPFHQEKTPSCYIYPDSNHYHCYGCGAHGDQLNFLMALDGVSFADAVKMLQNQ